MENLIIDNKHEDVLLRDQEFNCTELDISVEENEFVIINDHLWVCKGDKMKLCVLQPKNNFLVKLPKNNFEYLAAINACIDRTVPMTLIGGRAGSGKTIISLLSALYLMSKVPRLNVVFVKENVVATEYPLGFVKGTLTEKKAPIFQYLKAARSFIEKNSNITINMEDIRMETPAYLLGETFDDSIIIIDEAQNMSRKSIDLLATRVGKGTKIIVIGDGDQKYTKGTSGLAYLYDVMHGSSMFNDVMLINTDLRSPFVKEYHERKAAYYNGL